MRSCGRFAHFVSVIALMILSARNAQQRLGDAIAHLNHRKVLKKHFKNFTFEWLNFI
jgi:hypothetical protein